MKKIIYFSFVAAGLLVAGFASAQGAPSVTGTASTQFPIKELGNCADFGACKVYCDKSENISACVAYAEKSGMITKDEAERARQFSDVLKGEGPGACKEKKTCELYCSDVAHIDECLEFGEKHNLIPKEQLEQAKKVSSALKSGASLPGGCTDRQSCETFCGETKNVNACLNFAEQAGFMTADELKEARQVAPFLERGETPGGCKSKEACGNYCKIVANFSECIGFAEKAGFVSKEEADIARKAGGKGPGGCMSQTECDAYCNKEENAESCFKFAEEKGIIPAEKLKEIKDGMGRLRTGLEQMPPELTSCVKEKLGADVMAKIQAGTYTPGPGIGRLIEGCVSDYMPKIKEKLNQAMEIATPEVKKCLSEKVGDDNLEKLKNGEAPDPSTSDKMKECFDSMKTEGLKRLRESLDKMPVSAVTCLSEKIGADKLAKIRAGEDVELDPNIGGVIQSCISSTKQEMFRQAEDKLQTAPPEIRDCMKSKLEEMAKEAESGREPNVNEAVNECMKDFKPVMPEIPSADYVPPGMQGGGAGMVPPAGGSAGGSFTPPALPPGAEDCLKKAYGEETAAKIMRGEMAPPADISARIQKCMMSGFGAPR